MGMQRHEEFENDDHISSQQHQLSLFSSLSSFILPRPLQPVTIRQDKLQDKEERARSSRSRSGRRYNRFSTFGKRRIHPQRQNEQTKLADSSNIGNSTGCNSSSTSIIGVDKRRTNSDRSVNSLSSTTATSRKYKLVTNMKLTDRRRRRGKYTGQIDTSKRLPHGCGVMSYDDNCVYEGSWYNGIWSGCGTYTDNCTLNATYEGVFFDNHRHGLFVVRYADGRVYEGSYNMNRMQRGVMHIPNVGRYYGDFDENEQPHGRGKLLFYTSSSSIHRQYDGEFRHGQIDGHGRMVYGNLKQDNPEDEDENDVDVDVTTHSYSSASSTNTSRSTGTDYSFYLGSFSNGKRYGEGVLMIDEEIVHDGKWHDDEPVVVVAPSSLAGMAQWVPNKRGMCLGPIPQDIKPNSRFSTRNRKQKTSSSPNKDAQTNDGRTPTTKSTGLRVNQHNLTHSYK